MRGGVFLRFSPSRGRSDGTFHVPLRDRGKSLAATLRADPAKAAMLGTANGAVDPRIRASLHCLEVWGWKAFALALVCSGFCGRMPPNRGPLRRGEGA
jgi:hypothetical protein